MKRYIRANKGESPLDEHIDDLEADFEYVVDGIDKLRRMGSDMEKEALSITLELSSLIGEANAKISSLMV